MNISGFGSEKAIRARNRAILISLISLCAYIPVAYWGLERGATDEGPPPSAGIRVQISRPYVHLTPTAVTVRDRFGTFENAKNWRNVAVWEGNKRLEPATSNAAVSLGQGEFLYERGQGAGAWITWSASDNTDPVANGRSYWLVNPQK